jgi:hypothetical protein
MVGHFPSKRLEKWSFFLGGKGAVMDRASAELRITEEAGLSILDRTTLGLRITEHVGGSTMNKTFRLPRLCRRICNQTEESHSNAAFLSHQPALCELLPQVLFLPPMPAAPGLEAPLASSASCLDCLSPPIATSVDQDAEVCSPLPPYSAPADE